MFEPNYECNYSLMESQVQIRGNVELASTLRKWVRKNCTNFTELYEAQQKMREYCISNYGEEFYERSAEAIAFIVENEYCNIERSNNPYTDIKRYEEDMRLGVLY